tara:strand:+ start:747 stop:1094 length:348 start_codon:yes stop_codon:yes gene_type:complete
MARKIVALDGGWKIGETEYDEVELRDIHAGDLIEAGEAAERVVYDTNGNPTLVQSPTRMSIEVLFRQIVRIGELKDVPVTREMLTGLGPEDLDKLTREAETLSAAAEAAVARGRA